MSIASIQKILKPTKYRAVDTSGNNNHGQIYSGRGLEFDGIADYLSTGYNAKTDGITDNWTAVCWLKSDSFSTNQFALSFYQNSSDGLNLRIDTSGDIHIYEDIDGGDAQVYPTRIELNTWYRAVMVMDNLELKLYINGILVGSGTNASDGLDSFESDLLIGARSTSAGNEYWFSGMMSDFQMWNTVWTQSDVTYDYLNPESLALNNGGTSLTESNLKLWYPMQDGHRGQQSYVLDGANTGASNVSYYGGSTVAFASWTDGSGSGEWSVTNGIVTATDTGNLFYNNSATALVDGVTYKATIVVDSYTKGSVKAYAGGSQVDFGVTTAGTYSVYITNATSNNFAGLNGASFSGTISSVEFYPVNDKHHATTVFYGDNLYTAANALKVAADGTTADETNATTGWNDNGTSTFTTSSTSHSGSKSLVYEANVNHGGVSADLQPYLTVGRTYKLSLFVRHTTGGTAASKQSLRFSDASNLQSNMTEIAQIEPSDTTFAEVSREFVYDDDKYRYFGAKELNGDGSSGDGGLFMDTMYIKEVGVATGWTEADQQLDIPQTALQSYNQLAWFDGYDDNLDITEFDFTTGQTINMWVNPSELDNYRSLFGSGSTKSYMRYYNGAETEKFEFEPNEEVTALEIDCGSAGVIQKDKWTMYTFIWNTNRTMDVYLNGEKVGSSSATNNTTNGKTFKVSYFGRGYSSTPNYFQGAMTEISHYTDILTQSEINDLYNDGKAKSALEASGNGGLSAYWKNNGLAQWDDLKGSNHGTVTCDETLLLPAGVDASRDTQGFIMNKQKDTNALNLPNNNYDAEGYVDLAGARSVAADTAFSMTLWLKPDNIVDNRFFGDGNDYIRFRTNDDMRFYFGSSTYDLARNSGNFTKGEWVYIAFVRDTSNLVKMYIDGEVQTSTQTIDAAIDYRYIGANSDTNTFKGQIDDVMIYEGKEMSASEVKRNYNAGKRSHR